MSTSRAPDQRSAPPSDSTTAWLAHRLQADLGFQLDVRPQAQRLAQACSVVLCKKVQDPRATVKFEIVCLVDRESCPQQVFALDAQQLRDIGQACLPLAGKSMLGLVDNHLRVSVVEVSDHPPSEEDRARLQSLHTGPTSALLVESVYLDTTSRSRWSSAVSERLPGAGLLASSLTGLDTLSWSRWLEDVMHERALASAPGACPPRSAASDAQLTAPIEPPAIAPPPQAGHPASGEAAGRTTGAVKTYPIVTVSLVSLLVVAFLGEVALARSFDPDPEKLLAWGGMNSGAVREGEWFRLITASLLHGGIVHILMNCLALYLGGAVTEFLVGRGWMFVIYTLSALGGSILGLVLNDASIVSVGASGAIMGLLAASFALSLRLPKGLDRTSLQVQLARFLIPSLIPLASGAAGGGRIDYAAHFGGAVAGGLIGLLLVAVWREDVERPPLKKTGVGLALVAVGAFLLASAGVLRTYPARAAEAKLKADAVLVPHGSIPDNEEEAKRKVESWGKDRPRDPRVRLFRGMKLVDEHDLPGAEREFRAGLAEGAILRKFFGNRQLEVLLRGMLGAVLLDQDRRADAEKEAQPACNAGENGSVPEIFRRLELCNRPAEHIQ